MRGEENPEQQAEIRGLAEGSRLPLKFVQGIQMLYELQTLMVPIVNCSDYPVPVLCPKQEAEPWRLPPEFAALARIPGKHRGGCTGIIARTRDGTVAHARNLDFSPVDVMTQLVFTGIFTRGGREVFRSQMVAGYTGLVTGAKMHGDDGFAIERNTRYADHSHGNEEMFKHLTSGRPTNGWSLRKILEEESSYEGAVAAIARVPYVSTEYAIVSGVRKGTILAKEPDTVAHRQTLGERNIYQRDDYIIITNFDFFWDDIRENFDPTGGCLPLNPLNPGCHNRRVSAQMRLNATESLTEERLFEVIDGKGTIADTIFQAVINVEKRLWNVSQPDKIAPCMLPPCGDVEVRTPSKTGDSATVAGLEHHFNGVRSPLKSGVDGVAVRGKTDDMVRPWMDSSKSPSERVALLLPQLSLEEKVNQLLHVWVIRTNAPEVWAASLK